MNNEIRESKDRTAFSYGGYVAIRFANGQMPATDVPTNPILLTIPAYFSQGWKGDEPFLPTLPDVNPCDHAKEEEPEQCDTCLGEGDHECDCGHTHDCDECDGTGTSKSGVAPCSCFFGLKMLGRGQASAVVLDGIPIDPALLVFVAGKIGSDVRFRRSSHAGPAIELWNGHDSAVVMGRNE